jgi:GDPmannose 4,6-dehydratase
LPGTGQSRSARDWGFAKEYVEGMWRMLQADEPDTYVLATNRTETVRDFVQMAFKARISTLNFPARKTKKLRSTRHRQNGHAGQSALLSPCGSRSADRRPGKGDDKLGWKPETTLEQLCKMMVDADLLRNSVNASF